MSLFTELFTLTKARRFAMLVSSDHATGMLTISIMPRAFNETDGQYCKDLTLTAKPEDFDTDFVAAIDTYRSRLVPLLEQAKEATAAIDKAAQSVKAHAAAKAAGKAAAKPSPAAAAAVQQDSPAHGVEDQAKAYRAASSGDNDGDDAAEEELNNDWMKNRQPELF